VGVVIIVKANYVGFNFSKCWRSLSKIHWTTSLSGSAPTQITRSRYPSLR